MHERKFLDEIKIIGGPSFASASSSKSSTKSMNYYSPSQTSQGNRKNYGIVSKIAGTYVYSQVRILEDRKEIY